MSDDNSPHTSDPADASAAEAAGHHSTAPRRSGGVRLTVAFIAVAALAAVGGGVVASSIGQDSDTQTSSTTDSGEGRSTVEAVTTVANVQVAGEHRGLESVHQDGHENRENVLVTTDWLAERLDRGELQEQGIVLLDVSEELASSELTPYSEAHIPQAQYVNWSTEFTQPNTREFVSQE